MNISHLRYPIYVITVGLVIGFVADLLLYAQPFAISIPIIALMLAIGLIGLAVVGRKLAVSIQRRNSAR